MCERLNLLFMQRNTVCACILTFFKQKIRIVPYQGNLGLKISRFYCIAQPKEISNKSGINGPTFTKFSSYVAK